MEDRSFISAMQSTELTEQQKNALVAGSSFDDHDRSMADMTYHPDSTGVFWHFCTTCHQSLPQSPASMILSSSSPHLSCSHREVLGL